MSSLLQPGTTTAIPPTHPFDVTTAFVPDVKPEFPVRLSSVLPNFLRWFAAKSEPAGSSTALRWVELQRNASNSAILEDLGGESVAETTLAAAYWLMRQQHAGEPGPLATNGFSNVFYVRDTQGVLRSVSVHWCDDGWSIDAMRIDSLTEWPIRDRVFVPAR